MYDISQILFLKILLNTHYRYTIFNCQCCSKIYYEKIVILNLNLFKKEFYCKYIYIFGNFLLFFLILRINNKIKHNFF